MISVIIPTLNEAEALPVLLARLREMMKTSPGLAEIIVADGGSQDNTISLAERAGARVIQTQRGRGAQLRAGATLAQSGILWFLHADTVPAQEAVREMQKVLRADTNIVGGHLQISFTGGTGASFLTWLYPKLRLLGLCYGDTGFFVRRETYQACGGFRDLPLFEDLDFLRRVRRHGAFVALSVGIAASARRFSRYLFIRTMTRWCLLQILYWLGVKPATLVRWYPPVR